MGFGVSLLGPTPTSRCPLNAWCQIDLRLVLNTRRRFSSANNASPDMSESASSAKPGVELIKLTVKNNYGENLVGLLHETGSSELVILCHGLTASKEDTIMVNLADTISKEGISVFRFDFSGNGESEGSFQLGDYQKEVDDLRSVVLYFSGGKRTVTTILGHSKGGNVVLLYASRYNDVPTIVNASGRCNMEKGLDHLGQDFLKNIKETGFIDIKNKKGQYRITEESLMERLGTDMKAACLSIDKNCRVLTVHGSSDEAIPVEDAYEFSSIIPNHKLHIINGADHVYSKHQAELAEVVLSFINASMHRGKKVSKMDTYRLELIWSMILVEEVVEEYSVPNLEKKHCLLKI